MKTLIPLLITSLLFALQQDNPRIETLYDRFADATSVTLTSDLGRKGVVDLGGGSVYAPPGSNEAHVYFNIIGVVDGTEPKRGMPKVTIAFTSTSEDWIYLKQTNTLRFILNGTERLNLGVMSRGASEVMHKSGVIEQIALIVPFAVIQKLANSTKVEMQVSSDEFQLTQEQLADMKDWVSRFSATTLKK